jgi:predicted lactoylglutathione lyase
MTGTNFYSPYPILRVHDLSKSVEYYVNALGFKIDWQYSGVIVSVSRDSCGLMLSEGDQGNAGSWVWIGAGDVSKLYEEYKSKGAIIRQKPTNFQWAFELQIQDLDGNVLRFGSEPKENEPFGPWIDMYGNRWLAQRDGSWRKEMNMPGYEF